MTPVDMDEQWYGLILRHSVCSMLFPIKIYFVFVILRYSGLAKNSPELITCPYMVWCYYSVHGLYSIYHVVYHCGWIRCIDSTIFP